MDRSTYDMDYVATFFIGLVFAFSELLSRYREKPNEILKVMASYFYLGLNGAASILVYWLIQENNLMFGGLGEKVSGRVVIAGLSSMLVLRSSFLNFKNGEKTFDVGIATIMQIFLNTADRAFDQRTSETNIGRITNIMKDVDFKSVEISLPTTCLTLMQNLTDAEQKKLGQEVQKLSAIAELDGRTKSINLGIIISRFTGLNLLETTVKSLTAHLAVGAGGVASLEDETSRLLKEKAAQVMKKLKS